MNHPIPSARGRLRAGLSCALLALAMAACSDSSVAPLAVPEPPARPDPAARTVAVLECGADVRAGTVRCGEPGAAAGGARASVEHVFGGQGVNVRLASTNLAYDSVAEVFRADVTVQNLGVQRMGTDDGVTTSGIKVFFYSMNVTEGQGFVTLANADGEGDFIRTNEPYFEYPEILALNAVSAVHQWRWNVPKSVKFFTFQVAVSTRLLPVVVFDRVDANNRDIWRVAIDGSDLVRLTTHASDDQNPTFAAGRVVFTTFRHGNAELYSIPLTGGTETRLTTTSANEVDAALSRDGTRLAYISDATGVPKLWRASLAGGTVLSGAVRATPASFGFGGSLEAAPSWTGTADSSLVFVATNQGSSDLYRHDLPSAFSFLEGSANTDIEPAWSPDGTRVAFASNREGNTEIYVKHLGTGIVTRLTNRAGTDSQPTWLSDGRLAYVAFSGSPSTPRLYWVDPAVPFAAHEIPTGTGAAQRPSSVRL